MIKIEKKIKKIIWIIAGWNCLILAYFGLLLPGLPFSPFVVGSAYCFAKSSPKMHKWIYEHKIFGPFLTNWTEKRVMPLKMKYLMILTMATSLLVMWFSTYNIRAIMWSGTFMLLVACWAWRFPSSVEEYNRRIQQGKRVGWFK